MGPDQLPQGGPAKPTFGPKVGQWPAAPPPSPYEIVPPYENFSHYEIVSPY
jgi:hypothetical protein